MVFKSGLRSKLNLYFATSLLLFSLILGGVFIFSFQARMRASSRQALVNSASRLAESISSEEGVSFAGGLVGQGPSNGGPRGQGASGVKGSEEGQGFSNLGLILRVLRQTTDYDVWVVDTDYELVTGRRRGPKGQEAPLWPQAYEDLPEDGLDLVAESFSGQTAVGEAFNPFFTEPTLTVAVPIYTSDGSLMGSVLQHAPIRGMLEGVREGGLVLFFSLLLGLFLSFLFSLFLSRSFVRPLLLMQGTALGLAEGDFSLRSQVDDEGELGDLGRSLDTLAVRLGEAERQRRADDQARKDFMARVSHELRTPVTVLRGSLEALSEGVVTDKDKVLRYYDRMLAESIILERLVADLLELARLDNADFSLNMGDVFLSDLLGDLARSMGPVAKAKGVRLLGPFWAENMRAAEVIGTSEGAGGPDLGALLRDASGVDGSNGTDSTDGAGDTTTSPSRKEGVLGQDLAQDQDKDLTSPAYGASGLPEMSLRGDYGRLRQMLTAVVDNAVKFSSSGDRVWLVGGPGFIWVQDEGRGMTEAELSSAFQAFSFLPDQAGQEGTGLGLSIAKRIAERHGMSVQLDSVFGQGSRVTFSWPVDGEGL